jgi:hypothetical protein
MRSTLPLLLANLCFLASLLERLGLDSWPDGL